MQNKLMATWIIAAFLIGMMTVFSLLPSQSLSADQSGELSSTEYVIQGDDMASPGVEG